MAFYVIFSFTAIVHMTRFIDYCDNRLFPDRMIGGTVYRLHTAAGRININCRNSFRFHKADSAGQSVNSDFHCVEMVIFQIVSFQKAADVLTVNLHRAIQNLRRNMFKVSVGWQKHITRVGVIPAGDSFRTAVCVYLKR